MHFAKCLQRQQLLEIEFLDGANVLKKQTALPMFHLCKKGMRWLLKQYQREINAVEVDNLANDDGEWETMNVANISSIGVV